MICVYLIFSNFYGKKWNFIKYFEDCGSDLEVKLKLLSNNLINP